MLERLDEAELQSGDAVFFRRGDLWRGTLHTWDGVTYSAYGEGEKPLLYHSPESGVGAKKWSLVPGTDNIWVFPTMKPLEDGKNESASFPACPDGRRGFFASKILRPFPKECKIEV